MQIRGLDLVEKYQNAFLAKGDAEVCAEILDIVLFFKNPHVVLNGYNPLLQRYYLRLLISILKDQKGIEVFICCGRRHVELHQYFSSVLEGVKLETAGQLVRDKLRVVVFMNGSKIHKDDEKLIKEIQRGFPGLGLSYITIASAEIAEELQAKCFNLEQDAQQERIQSLINNNLSACRRRRLVKILTR